MTEKDLSILKGANKEENQETKEICLWVLMDISITMKMVIW